MEKVNDGSVEWTQPAIEGLCRERASGTVFSNINAEVARTKNFLGSQWKVSIDIFLQALQSD